MDDESGDVAGEDDLRHGPLHGPLHGPQPSTAFQPAYFRDEQRLPPGDDQLLFDAALAVHQEYRECSRWKRLHCRKVSVFAERDRGAVFVLHVRNRVEFATAFKATCYLQDEFVLQMLETGDTPFTTILIDEAGLMSRAATAGLSLLAARRVVLVGDSKQLAPISRISRVLPRRHQTWLASSGLSHLDTLDNTPTAVHVLSQQRRMHPEVCRVVSDFHYGGFLTTAPEIDQRSSSLPPILANHSRAIWYVLDAEGSDLAAIRAQRGPANQSWTRLITPAILEKFFSDSGIRQANGLFISPYQAQTKAVAKLFSAWGLTSWEASTVHSQQGSESDIVLFDAVNAGSYSWPCDEWKRLVNVALSRAREAILVFASRAEMEEPYLQPLIQLLTPSVLVQDNGRLHWEKVPAIAASSPTRGTRGVAESPQGYRLEQPAKDSMGEQIRQRRDMQPVLSREQQRLVDDRRDEMATIASDLKKLIQVEGFSPSDICLIYNGKLAVQTLQHELAPELSRWGIELSDCLAAMNGPDEESEFPPKF